MSEYDMNERDGNVESVNAFGGRQSEIPCRFDLIPACALHEVAKVLKEAAKKYGEGNWRRITLEDHLSHALRHGYRACEAHRTGSEDPRGDLVRLACRALLALEIGLVGFEFGDENV